MRRREFIAGLAGAAAWPLAVRAQQPKAQVVVGLLNGVAFDGPYAAAVAAIRQGLQETGFVEGQNLAIEYRTADGRYERLADLAADLVRLKVAVIVAIGAPMPTLAVRTAAPAVPMVFAMGSDVVEVGVAYGLDRPVSVTGVNFGAAELPSRRLEWLLELRPRASLIGYLDNSRLSEAFTTNVENITTAARIRGRELAVFDASTGEDIATAFTNMALQRVRGLVVGPDPFLTTRQEQIIALAAESRMPAIYTARGAVVLGGLMSYGARTTDMYRLAGIYAGRILQGGTPAESPVALPTTFELVINGGTARAQRISVPRRLLVRADEIIE